jgi:hypothetical protein
LVGKTPEDLWVEFVGTFVAVLKADVSAKSVSLNKCENTTVIASLSGFSKQDTPTIVWSYDLLKGFWFTEMDQLMQNANDNQNTTLILSNEFTSKITVNETLRFNIKATLNGQTAIDSVVIDFNPLAYTELGGVNSSYTIRFNESLMIVPFLS